MATRWMKLAVLVLLAVTQMNPQCPPPAPVKDERLVLQAIAGLQDRDYVVVRRAINSLCWLMEAKNITTAIKPLIGVMQGDEVYYDSYTRSLAPHALMLIAKKQGWPRNKRSFNAMIGELSSGNSELVRASVAKELGSIDLPIVEQPLIQANEGDPSPLVRMYACDALLMYSNGLYNSESCHYEEEEPMSFAAGPQTMSAMSAVSLPFTESDDEQMLRWVKAHVLLPSDSSPRNPQAGE